MAIELQKYQVYPKKSSPRVRIQLNSSKFDALPEGEKIMVTEIKGCKSTVENKENTFHQQRTEMKHWRGGDVKQGVSVLSKGNAHWKKKKKKTLKPIP